MVAYSWKNQDSASPLLSTLAVARFHAVGYRSSRDNHYLPPLLKSSRNPWRNGAGGTRTRIPPLPPMASPWPSLACPKRNLRSCYIRLRNVSFPAYDIGYSYAYCSDCSFRMGLFYQLHPDRNLGTRS